MASRKFKKMQRLDSAQPQEPMAGPAAQTEFETQDLQERYRHLDHTNARENPGLAGTRARRRNNAANPHVAKGPGLEVTPKETQVVNGR